VTHHFVRTDGQGKINVEAVRYLAESGWRVELVCERVDTDLLRYPDVRWHRVPSSRLPTTWLKQRIFARRAAATVAQLRRKNKNIVVVGNGSCISAPTDLNIAMFVHAAWWKSPHHPRHARPNGKSRVWRWYQTLASLDNKREERRAFQQAKVVIALADSVRNELIEQVGVPSDRIVVVNPGVDSNLFTVSDAAARSQFRASIGTSDECLVALFAGDIRTTRKNLELVLKALRQLPEPVELWVAGSTAGSPYPQYAADLGVGKRVRWLGHRTEMQTVMGAADIFLFPSHYEPFGLVVLEALSAGLPVVVTRQTGSSDAVSGLAGVVLQDSGDLPTLIASVKTWVECPQLLSAAKAAAREAGVSRSWDEMGKRYSELILGYANSHGTS
jgi:glycosyltransferase involved in cell wall biosynthesis